MCLIAFYACRVRLNFVGVGLTDLKFMTMLRIVGGVLEMPLGDEDPSDLYDMWLAEMIEKTSERLESIAARITPH